jgi:hypothetical protein
VFHIMWEVLWLPQDQLASHEQLQYTELIMCLTSFKKLIEGTCRKYFPELFFIQGVIIQGVAESHDIRILTKKQNQVTFTSICIAFLSMFYNSWYLYIYLFAGCSCRSRQIQTCCTLFSSVTPNSPSHCCFASSSVVR